MDVEKYIKETKVKGITKFGFDTQARVLDISKQEVKKLWNKSTNNQFKRFPRTEYLMRPMPELSTRMRPYWEVNLPKGVDYLMFYITPTAPILIPHKFLTDKGSIPLIFQNIVSIYDRELIMAFLTHDVECDMQRMSRFSTDGLIYEVGTEMGAPWMRKNMVYSAVRMGNRYGRKDKVIRGFNVSEYNRDLIHKADNSFLSSGYMQEHLKTIKKLGV